MTFSRTVPAAFCAALLAASFSPSAKADDTDKKTTITFSAPVEIPAVHVTGMSVLPAGTYVFKLLSSSSNRHIVQIFNKEQTKIYATILAIPNYRLVAKNKTSMTFYEGIKGKPEALRAWFYPGANWGEEFVYPKAKAVDLAKVTKAPVLVADVPAEAAKPEEPAIIAQLTEVPVRAVRPTGEEVEIAQVIQTAPEPTPAPRAVVAQVQATPAALVADDRLPDTASTFPLFALCGLLALGGGLTIRSITKQSL